MGSIQINLIGQDRWERYPLWRQKNGKGRKGRDGLNNRVSDASIRTEMSIFRAIMAFAAGKKYIPEGQSLRASCPWARYAGRTSRPKSTVSFIRSREDGSRRGAGRPMYGAARSPTISC